jgi:Cu2+-exporting ATPase
VIAILTSLGAQSGLLVKDRLALEGARNLDVIVFDKTGTLTRGAPAPFGVAVAAGVREDNLFSLAAAVEGDSEHPLAKVVAEAKRRGLMPRAASQFEALPGRGAQAMVNGEIVAVGGPRLLTEMNLVPPPEVAKMSAASVAEGKPVLFVVSQNHVLGALTVEDEIRPESKEAVDELHRLGMRVAMITVDSKTVAESVAQRLGIDEVAADVLPAVSPVTNSLHSGDSNFNWKPSTSR